MDRLSQRSIQDNRENEGSWQVYGTHRATVSQLLRVTPNRSPLRLCVLGAGNCNDLDLNLLLKTYQEVHLVDLDGEALARGADRQELGDSPAIHRHGALDVSGMLKAMALWSPTTSISDADIASCIGAPARSVLPVLSWPFDVVVSTCILSQLLRGVVLTAGESHPQFVRALQAIRTGHLRLLAELVANGGCGLLITDLVSSESFPALRSVPENLLSSVLVRLVQEHNFFHGLNPSIVAAFFRTDPVVAPRVSKVALIQPWIWDFGIRAYGVYAVRFIKDDDGLSRAGTPSSRA